MDKKLREIVVTRAVSQRVRHSTPEFFKFQNAAFSCRVEVNKYFRSALLWDFTQRRMVVFTDVSGQPTCPV